MILAFLSQMCTDTKDNAKFTIQSIVFGSKCGSCFFVTLQMLFRVGEIFYGKAGRIVSQSQTLKCKYLNLGNLNTILFH